MSELDFKAMLSNNSIAIQLKKEAVEAELWNKLLVYAISTSYVGNTQLNCGYSGSIKDFHDSINKKGFTAVVKESVTNGYHLLCKYDSILREEAVKFGSEVSFTTGLLQIKLGVLTCTHEIKGSACFVGSVIERLNAAKEKIEDGKLCLTMSTSINGRDKIVSFAIVNTSYQLSKELYELLESETNDEI